MHPSRLGAPAPASAADGPPAHGAGQCCDRALGDCLRHAATHAAKSETLSALGRHGDAVERVRRSARIDPRLPEARVALAKVLLGAGHGPASGGEGHEAMDAADETIAADRGHAGTRHELRALRARPREHGLNGAPRPGPSIDSARGARNTQKANALIVAVAPPLMDGAMHGLQQAAELARDRNATGESAEAEYDLAGAGARARPQSPWDEPDAVRLGLALRRLGRFDMSSHGGRLAFQKSVYLLQAFGVYLGYRFSWYIRGPYSSRLARHGFALESAYGLLPDTGLRGDRPTEKRFARFLEFMADKKDDPPRLEALASAHFMRRLCGDLGDREIAARVAQRQPYLGTDMCRRGLDELRSEGLV